MLRRACFLLIMLLSLTTAYAQVDEDLQELLDEYVAEDELAVVVFSSYDDEIYYAAQGLADLDNEIAVQPDDLFRIGSITKMFVSVVMLQLVDEELVDLDDTISDYLTDDSIAAIENTDTATIRQMLQMTSGIASYTDSDAFGDAVDDNPYYAWTAAEALQTIEGVEADFEPGTDYYYSNSNYLLAELVIEAVTGESLADNLKTRIFEPLEMASCFLETPDRFADGIIRGYTDDGEWIDITEENDGVGLGDGGIICNAEDLLKFATGFQTLLSEDAYDAMLDAVEDGYGSWYGLGIGIDDSDYGRQIGHDGSTSGFQSNMVYLPDEDVAVVILTNNFDSEIVYELTEEVQYWTVED